MHQIVLQFVAHCCFGQLNISIASAGCQYFGQTDRDAPVSTIGSRDCDQQIRFATARDTPDLIHRHTCCDQRAGNRIGASLAEALIVTLRSDRVGVSHNHRWLVAVDGLQSLSDFSDLLPAFGIKLVRVKVEIQTTQTRCKAFGIAG
ncbi:hypothetical protein [Ruegeria arenilitoris]|uniref:hypothetical protein n=1 Tax=Ruegeria arenilitoris TaxID=1173585 RepID=UPI0020C1F98D|nr:hypothetical protein [Ruegeria arenilitoris]